MVTRGSQIIIFSFPFIQKGYCCFWLWFRYILYIPISQAKCKPSTPNTQMYFFIVRLEESVLNVGYWLVYHYCNFQRKCHQKCRAKKRLKKKSLLWNFIHYQKNIFCGTEPEVSGSKTFADILSSREGMKEQRDLLKQSAEPQSQSFLCSKHEAGPKNLHF